MLGTTHKVVRFFFGNLDPLPLYAKFLMSSICLYISVCIGSNPTPPPSVRTYFMDVPLALLFLDRYIGRLSKEQHKFEYHGPLFTMVHKWHYTQQYSQETRNTPLFKVAKQVMATTTRCIRETLTPGPVQSYIGIMRVQKTAKKVNLGKR